MAEKLLGPVFEIHGGGLDLVFPHHENELAQSRALGHEFAKIWMHNGMLRFTGEKMSKSVGNVETIAEVLDRGGAETVLLFFLTAHWRKPIDFSDERWRDAQARAEGLREVFRNPSEPARTGCLGAVRRRRSTTTSTRLPRSRSCTSGATTSCCAARSASSVFRPRQSRRRRRPRCTRWPPAPGGARREGLRTRPTELREQIEAAGWDVRDDVGRLPARSQAVTREQVYGRRPVREALRGRREVLEVWATERAAVVRAVAGGGAPRLQIKPDREIGEAAGTRDHQGVLAWTEPYRYADAHELAGAEQPLLACLDQVTDPRNLGAVIRSAEGAGATGVVVPAHGSAMVTAAVAGRRQARSSTCRSPSSRTSRAT